METVDPTVDQTTDSTDQPTVDQDTDGLDLLDDAAALVDESQDAPVETDLTGEGEGKVEGEDSTDTDATEDKKLVETKPQPAAISPVVDQARQQADQSRTERQQRITEINRQVAELSKASGDDFEANHKLTRLLAEKDTLRDQEMDELRVVAQQVREHQAADQFWYDFGASNPDIGADKGRKLFNEIAAEVGKKYGNGPAGLGVATDRFESRINLIRKQQQARQQVAKPGTPKPRVTPGGGRVVPKTASTNAPPKQKDELDELISSTAGSVRDYMP